MEICDGDAGNGMLKAEGVMGLDAKAIGKGIESFCETISVDVGVGNSPCRRYSSN